MLPKKNDLQCLLLAFPVFNEKTKELISHADAKHKHTHTLQLFSHVVTRPWCFQIHLLTQRANTALFQGEGVIMIISQRWRDLIQ